MAEPPELDQNGAAWLADCEEYHGRLLVGLFRHWCDDWDGLPVDETCHEWPCACRERLERERA